MSANAERSVQAAPGARNGPLDVVFLADHLGHADGRIHGVTTYFLETLPAFEPGRVVPTLCVLQPRHAAAAQFEAAGIPPLFLARTKWDPRAFMDLLHVLGRRRVDILHMHGEKSLMLGRVAACLMGWPTIAHFHDTLPAPPWTRFMQRRLARWTSGAVAVSRVVRDWAIKEFALPPERIQVIHNGHRIARFATPAEGARQRIREELALGEMPVIGVIGRIDRNKGQETMIRAMPLLLELCPKAVLLVVGEGPDRSTCEALVRTKRLAAAVRFTGQRQDVPELLAAMDVVVLPSLSEGLPFVAMEAAAAGRPVVGFRTGGIPEIVLHETTGLLASPGDLDGLVNSLARVLQDAGLRRCLGERSQTHAQQFTVDRHARRLEAVYAAVARPRRSSSTMPQAWS